ncbi:MAG: cytidylate kinase, partial [Gammaproteobacteria bacterium]|nr:cytidylate kinase [Gammaproteobacteria bacterium]
MADHEMGVPVITIDGPGGSGKGTIAMRLAEHLGWHFLDSGALYRLVAVAAMSREIAVEDEQALGSLAESLDVNFGVSGDGMVILLDGNYITGHLRSEEVSAFSSEIAAFPLV